MTATLRTDVGKTRRQNEDAAWFDEKLGVFAVADGMGGHLAGEVASGMAIDAVKRMAASQEIASISVMRDAVRDAHEAILAHAKENPACSGMGTTLSVMWRGGHYMYIAHVGDSRIYRLRGGDMEQITQDHSLVEELVRARIITKDEARRHPRRNIITRALGTPGDNAPDLLAADRKRGDLWLLCTDGLTGMVADGDIERVLRENDMETAADRLLALALEAGGRDNVTLILCAREGDGTWNRD